MKYNFTEDESNLILNALGNMPFFQVYQLINNIQKQAQEQLNTPQKEELEND
jgi:dihydroxyacetone kinase